MAYTKCATRIIILHKYIMKKKKQNRLAPTNPTNGNRRWGPWEFLHRTDSCEVKPSNHQSCLPKWFLVWGSVCPFCSTFILRERLQVSWRAIWAFCQRSVLRINNPGLIYRTKSQWLRLVQSQLLHNFKNVNDVLSISKNCDKWSWAVTHLLNRLVRVIP